MSTPDEYVVIEIPPSLVEKLLSAPPCGWGDVMGLEDDLERRLAMLPAASLDGHEAALQSAELRLFLTGASVREAEDVFEGLLRSRPAGRIGSSGVRFSGGEAAEQSADGGGSKRQKVRAGDVFRIQLAEGDAVFGRVIDAGFVLGKVPGLVLVYIYDVVSTRTTPDMSSLSPQCLLIPVQITNLMGWKRGAFRTVAHQSLSASDRLAVHNFQYWDKDRPIIVDERGVETDRPCDPCGVFLLSSYNMIVDKVGEALGRVRVEEPS